MEIGLSNFFLMGFPPCVAFLAKTFTFYYFIHKFFHGYPDKLGKFGYRWQI